MESMVKNFFEKKFCLNFYFFFPSYSHGFWSLNSHPAKNVESRAFSHCTQSVLKSLDWFPTYLRFQYYY